MAHTVRNATESCPMFVFLNCEIKIGAGFPAAGQKNIYLPQFALNITLCAQIGLSLEGIHAIIVVINYLPRWVDIWDTEYMYVFILAPHSALVAGFVNTLVVGCLYVGVNPQTII